MGVTLTEAQRKLAVAHFQRRRDVPSYLYNAIASQEVEFSFKFYYSIAGIAMIDNGVQKEKVEEIFHTIESIVDAVPDFDDVVSEAERKTGLILTLDKVKKT